MAWSSRAWFLGIAALALVPAGFRVWSWTTPAPKPVDPAEARAGQELFRHEFTWHDPLTASGDGLGPVYNANSCVACHNQGGPGGGGGLEHNVTTFVVKSDKPGEPAREGVVHSHALSPQYQETLAQVHPSLPAVSNPPLSMLVPIEGANHRNGALGFPHGVHLSQRNTPALFGASLIDQIPDRVILANERAEHLKWGLQPADEEKAPVGRASRLANGRVGRFGWKGQIATLDEFVQAACANELGLGNPGHPQPKSLAKPDYQAAGLDLTLEQCGQLTAFVSSLPRPVERLPEAPAAREQATAGREMFSRIGCAECHTPKLGSVDGIYSDLLLHRMGQVMVGGGSYGEPPVPLPDVSPGEGPRPDEWRTPPLWGVADSAPYLHDGRAATLEDAIKLHAGQAARAEQNFERLSDAEQKQLVAFLKTLRAP